MMLTFKAWVAAAFLASALLTSGWISLACALAVAVIFVDPSPWHLPRWSRRSWWNQ